MLIHQQLQAAALCSQQQAAMVAAAAAATASKPPYCSEPSPSAFTSNSNNSIMAKSVANSCPQNPAVDTRIQNGNLFPPSANLAGAVNSASLKSPLMHRLQQATSPFFMFSPANFSEEFVMKLIQQQQLQLQQQQTEQQAVHKQQQSLPS
uniref:Uncharacterized protein n=1 Tax=Ditylenchus dipsaci TaxID=166011 RepID=A0A915EH55_9BILA